MTDKLVYPTMYFLGILVVVFFIFLTYKDYQYNHPDIPKYMEHCKAGGGNDFYYDNIATLMLDAEKPVEKIASEYFPDNFSWAQYVSTLRDARGVYYKIYSKEVYSLPQGYIYK